MIGGKPLASGVGLEPTYKGLKRCYAEVSSNASENRLEPTYKGLKRIRPHRFASLLGARLEPTYKGLKRLNWRLACSSHLVWSLPIRD